MIPRIRMSSKVPISTSSSPAVEGASGPHRPPAHVGPATWTLRARPGILVGMAYLRRALVLTALALACDPSEHQNIPPEDQPTECVLADEVRASFSLDLGDWVRTGDDYNIKAACTVDAVGSELTFQCDDAGQQRPITLTLTTSRQLTPPLQVGDAVTLTVQRGGEVAVDRGFWAVHSGDGQLLLAGARSFSSVPAGAPDFFAPLTLTVDFTTCPEQKTDSCKLEQRVILSVADGGGDTRVPQGSDAALPSGLEMLVERSQLTMASSDAKSCPIDESTPETFQFIVAMPPT